MQHRGVGLLLSMRLGKSKLAHACMPVLLGSLLYVSEGCAHLEPPLRQCPLSKPASPGRSRSSPDAERHQAGGVERRLQPF